jgi:diguanylate cyclase (GGDEF)-like protein
MAAGTIQDYGGPENATQNPMTILIADDDAVSRRVLEQTLKSWGYGVTAAADGAEAWRILSGSDAPCLAILDWMMPGYTGPELCRMVRQRAREPYTYILLLTSRSERGDIVEGMDSGADDYVTKPFDRHELQVRLRAGTRIVDLQAQLLTTREALRVQATRDYLTQTWNRSAILEILERELSRSDREGTPVGVVVSDLDHFKAINDTFGHLAGDLALQHAARRMQTSMRAYDSLGRYGGEEFVVVLPGADEHMAQLQAERMRVAIAQNPILVTDRSITITSSFGCTSGHGGRVNAEALIRAADLALYEAKRQGRDCVRTATECGAAKAATPIATSAPPQSD